MSATASVASSGYPDKFYDGAEGGGDLGWLALVVCTAVVLGAVVYICRRLRAARAGGSDGGADLEQPLQPEADEAIRQTGRGPRSRPEFRGGDLDMHFAGVTGLVGEPHEDLSVGVRTEHLEMPDSRMDFTTQNYGITTTPELEYTLVTRYDGAGGDNIEIAGTRRCPNARSQMQGDRRTLHPLSHYEASEVVRQAGLQRVEISVLVLYTGPMRMLYMGFLRGSGFCGAVDEGVEFWSGDGEFEAQLKARSIIDRMQVAGHRFSSTLHVMASAVRKLSRNITGFQGSWVYRSLGLFGTDEFLASNGVTERAFMSTTQHLEVALEYSEFRGGLQGSVLAIEMSETDRGVVLQPFSQYPGEEEILWNACSFMEPLREEVRQSQWGPVRVIYVRMTAGRALTVEELEGRRRQGGPRAAD